MKDTQLAFDFEIKEETLPVNKTKNSNLHKAKKEKNDEFYTQLSDIEKEMVYYKDFFKGKVVHSLLKASRRLIRGKTGDVA